jgi:spore germination protein GerM
MEEQIFLEEAVASLMKQHLVEARLHTDSQKHLTDEQFANNKKAQAELAGVTTNPYFVMVDPTTGDKVAEFSLSGGFGAWKGNWIQFLRGVANKTGR